MKNKLKVLTIVDLAKRKTKAQLQYCEIGFALGFYDYLTEEIIKEIEDIIIMTVKQKLIEVRID